MGESGRSPVRNKFSPLSGRRSNLLQQVGQAHRIAGASFPSHGNFPLDNRSGPCYDRQRGLDIPDVSPEGNPLPRRPEFEPSAGRPSLFPIVRRTYPLRAWRNGRRARLRIWCLRRAGSTPVTRTKKTQLPSRESCVFFHA